MQFKHMQLYQESFKILFYSIKLKLEMNILSKLVDLVHGSSVKNRSMTLEAIDSNAVQGQAQRDVQREMAGPESPINWYASDSKGGMGSFQNDVPPDVRYRPSMSGSGSGSSPDDAAINRVLSHPTSVKARANGREVDALYADYLRSL